MAKITEIDWDTDGETVDLPTEVEIDLAAEGITSPRDEIADWLSDRYNWCVNGFSVDYGEDEEPSAPKR
jgi:hypothetical protein